MFKLRVNLIFGTIKFIIKTIFKVVYKVLSLFNLQLLLFVALVGLVLFLTGVMTSSSAVRIIFFVSLCFSIVYALVMTIRRLLGIGKKKNKKFGSVEVVEESKKEDDQNIIAPAPQPTNPPAYNPPKESEREDVVEKYFRQEEPTYPRYYNVRGRPGYVMAEYKDRYVLYQKTANGMKQIRTDVK